MGNELSSNGKHDAPLNNDSGEGQLTQKRPDHLKRLTREEQLMQGRTGEEIAMQAEEIIRQQMVPSVADKWTKEILKPQVLNLLDEVVQEERDLTGEQKNDIVNILAGWGLGEKMQEALTWWSPERFKHQDEMYIVNRMLSSAEREVLGTMLFMEEVVEKYNRAISEGKFNGAAYNVLKGSTFEGLRNLPMLIENRILQLFNLRKTTKNYAVMDVINLTTTRFEELLTALQVLVEDARDAYRREVRGENVYNPREFIDYLSPGLGGLDILYDECSRVLKLMHYEDKMAQYAVPKDRVNQGHHNQRQITGNN